MPGRSVAGWQDIVLLRWTSRDVGILLSGFAAGLFSATALCASRADGWPAKTLDSRLASSDHGSRASSGRGASLFRAWIRDAAAWARASLLSNPERTSPEAWGLSSLLDATLDQTVQTAAGRPQATEDKEGQKDVVDRPEGNATLNAAGTRVEPGPLGEVEKATGLPEEMARPSFVPPPSCEFWTDSWPEPWQEARGLAKRIQLQAGGVIDRRMARSLRNLTQVEALEALEELQRVVGATQSDDAAGSGLDLSAWIFSRLGVIRRRKQSHRLALGGNGVSALSCKTCPNEGIQEQSAQEGKRPTQPRTLAGFLEASEQAGDPRRIHNAALVDFGDGQRLLPVSLKYLDRFLKLRCCVPMLEMGLFPDAKEISESMGCLWAVKTHLPDVLRWDESAVTCVVVGDGCRPRTAALCCFLTRWRRVLSIDPSLGPSSERIRAIERLELRAERIQAVTVDLDVKEDAKVLIMLPHAHVCPNDALACLRVPATALQDPGQMPQISCVQLPCCEYEYHDRVAAQDPDAEYADPAIGSSRRTVRVWRDVGPAAMHLRAIGVGDERPEVQRRPPWSSSVDVRGWSGLARRARHLRRGGTKQELRRLRRGLALDSTQ